MENRLYLNKKPKYELPDEVKVGEYTRRNNKEDITPDFEPDIVINSFTRNICIDIKKRTFKQIWIKSDNKKLLDFISRYSWNDVVISTTSSAKQLTLPLFKKIILEEFYGVKDGE